MSAVEPGSTHRHDAPGAIALRLGAVVAVALILAVAVNVFAASLAFSILLAALAASTAWGEQAADAVARRRAPRGDEEKPIELVEPEPATPPPAPSTPAAGASGSS